MDTIDPNTLLQGCILAAVLWFGRSVISVREGLVQIKTILTGADGSPGLTSEVRGLRTRAHQLGDTVHTLAGKVERHAERLDALEDAA